MKTERWEPISGYESYRISSFGRVKNKKDRVLKNRLDGKGYYMVTLCKNGIPKTFSIHRLVASVFISNSDNKETVNHINGDKLDNRIENLEWTTQSENNKHAYSIGLSKPKIALGVANGRAKLTEDCVKQIKELLNDNVLTQKQIAQKFDISVHTVNNINVGKTWSHIN